MPPTRVLALTKTRAPMVVLFRLHQLVHQRGRGREPHSALLPARREDVELYGVDIPLINAFARVERGCSQVILFEGIQQVVLFYAHLITAMNLLNRLRPNRHIDIDGWRETEGAAFSLAGFSLLYNYMKTGQVLIALGDILGPAALHNTRLGYAATIAFLLAHELGHLVLGHTGPSGAVAERNQVPLAVEQNINRYQENEFAAPALRP
jgi:hypothetical protein